MRLILIDPLLKVVLPPKVHLDPAGNLTISGLIAAHRLELVGVLTESFRVLREVYLDVRDVADLVSCQDAKDLLLRDGLDLTALKLMQVSISVACFITGEFFTE